MSPAAKLDEDAARRAVLEAADSVFYARGIGGTSIAEIRDASGVALRRLYGLYPSKHELVAGWLEARHASWMTWFQAGVEARGETGIAPVDAIFETLAEWASTPGYRGCAFLNTTAEVAEIDDRHRRIIAAHKGSLVEYLAQLMRETGAREPESLATGLGVLVDGAIVQAAVFGSLEPIRSAKAVARGLVDCARDGGQLGNAP